MKSGTLGFWSYLFDISQYILLPLYSFVRLFVYSFDVIHTLGIYSWGIKIDAIPGRINLATTLRLVDLLVLFQLIVLLTLFYMILIL